MYLFDSELDLKKRRFFSSAKIGFTNRKSIQKRDFFNPFLIFSKSIAPTIINSIENKKPPTKAGGFINNFIN
jgi:hypothetical protein